MYDGTRVCQITSGEDKVTDTPLVNLLMNTLQDLRFQILKVINEQFIKYEFEKKNKIKNKNELRFQDPNAFNQLYVSRCGVRSWIGRLSSAGLHNSGCRFYTFTR